MYLEPLHISLAKNSETSLSLSAGIPLRDPKGGIMCPGSRLKVVQPSQTHIAMNGGSGAGAGAGTSAGAGAGTGAIATKL